MAAEALTNAGFVVDVYDAMPSVGRKFLLAGIGGLNITHSEDYETFCSRYGVHRSDLQQALDHFSPSALRQWIHQLGIETYVGSSGRVFPTQMKAAPLLRAWIHRLRIKGVRFHVRHRWEGWNADGSLRITNSEGELRILPSATVLALGGASWPKFGSDGNWVPILSEAGVQITPLQSANCGFDVSWSKYLSEKFAGSPLKGIALTFTDTQDFTERRQGEIIVSEHGVEGSLIYAFSSRLREKINLNGSATFTLDLIPHRSLTQVIEQIRHPRGSRSLPNHLQSRLGLHGIKLALLHEVLSKEDFSDIEKLANTIKSLPVTVYAPRPIAEAISTAGGVNFKSLDRNLMIMNRPGTFVAGEMVDWEAPTGGYLLTGCMALGMWAGLGVSNWLKEQH